MKTVVSKAVEIFYRSDGETVELYPRFCIDESMINFRGADCLRDGITLLEQMRRKPDSMVCFWRTFALGDILLLTPIFNWLKGEYPSCQILLATATGFLGLFQYWDLIRTVDKRHVIHSEYDAGYYLDGIVERDHSGGEFSYKHRLDIYCDFLGIPVPKDPLFSLPYGEDERIWAKGIVSKYRENGKPVVIMQVFGSTKIKRLPIGKVMKIALELSKTALIIMVHNSREWSAIDGIIDFSGVTSVHQLVALIDCADVVITMDSGILWVAHCTGTPVIALLGPTREQERMVYHRNYHVVNLSKMVGCEPCFERAIKCQGKINCMNEMDENQIVKEIRDGINKFAS